jgi:hypothetical protein
MKTPFYKSPKAHKWGLFCLLAGALAFDLSINPQTQNFAADFASTSPQSETVTVKDDSNTSYEFVVSKQDGKVQDAKFVNNGTAADNGLCPTLCGKLIDLKGISNIEDVLKFEVREAKNSTNRPAVADNADDRPAPKKIQRPGHATDVDIAEWAAKCDNKSKDQKLECQSKRLVDLSKYMEDSEDQQNVIAKYFTKYVEPGMSKKYKSPVYKREDGSYTLDDDAISDMDDLASDILSGLRDDNGKKTRELLTKMISKSYAEQIKAGQNMVREGQATSNTMEIYAGIANMSPQYLSQRLSDEADTLNSSGDDSIDDLISKNLNSPVSSMLSQMYLSGQKALSQNAQISKMSNGFPSPCFANCVGYMSFNPDAYADLNNIDVTAGLSQIANSTRAFGRGSAITNAPWFSNATIGANGQIQIVPQRVGQPQVGQIGTSIPGAYQPTYQATTFNNGMVGQPVGQVGFSQPGTMMPTYQQPTTMLPNTGLQPVPGYNNSSTIRSAGGGRIQ